MKDIEKIYSIIQKYRSDLSLTLFDIGAADGPNDLWNLDFVNIIGFEPDVKEFEKLSKINARNRTYFNTALSGSNKKIKINICRKQQVSSELIPNRSYLDDFTNSDRFEIIDNYECDAVTVDHFCEVNNIQPDIIKIDTQGTELEILKGSTNTLKKTIFSEVETEFHDFYVNQPTFADIHNFFIEKKFRLYNINPIQWRRKIDLIIVSRPEIIFCDALYLNENLISDHSKSTNTISEEIILKYLLIAYNLNFRNYSYFLFRKFENIIQNGLREDLINYFLLEQERSKIELNLENKEL